ncbi:hypothetical protein ACULLL_11085 [Lysinibacillus irui]
MDKIKKVEDRTQNVMDSQLKVPDTTSEVKDSRIKRWIESSY